MAFIPLPQGARLNINYDWAGQFVENTLWFTQVAGNYDATALNDLAAKVDTVWQGEVMPHLSQDLVYRGIVAYAQHSDVAPAINFPVPPVAGGRGVRAVPNNVAWCIQLRTAFRGKSGRGRNYIPGLADEDVVNNALNQTIADALVGAYSSLLGPGPIDPHHLVVASHYTAGAPRGIALAVQVLNIGYSDLIVDSQRRRLPKRGT